MRVIDRLMLRFIYLREEREGTGLIFNWVQMF